MNIWLEILLYILITATPALIAWVRDVVRG